MWGKGGRELLRRLQSRGDGSGWDGGEVKVVWNSTGWGVMSGLVDSGGSGCGCYDV